MNQGPLESLLPPLTIPFSPFLSFPSAFEKGLNMEFINDKKVMGITNLWLDKIKIILMRVEAM